MPEAHELTFNRSIAAAPAEVVRAFTHPTLLRDWLCDAADVEARPGGRVYLFWRGVEGPGYAVTGWLERLDAGGLVLRWLGSGDPGETQVRVDCQPEGAGTRLALSHGGLGEGEAWQALAQRWQADWTSALENLQSVLEQGVDLRMARRPRLGIWMDELTAEKAAALGAPGAAGVLLHGTLEGSGAQAAGLQKDDILTSLNGVALESPHSFARALHGLSAGDRPQVEYYRAGQKHSAALALGSFPISPLPESTKALAEQVRASYAAMVQSIRAQVGGLSDEQAARRAQPGSWSVLELVAHLTLMERDYQSWLADMLNDTPVQDDLQMRPNVDARIAALLARLPRLEAQDGRPGLLDELALAQEETACLLESLPEDFTRARKHLYRRAAEWALEAAPAHYSEEHAGQFQQAVDAARA